MVEVIKDKDDKVIAFCEWNLLDRNGHFDDKGKYVWVQDLWIHDKHRGNGMLRDIINKIALQRAPESIICSFRRGKHNKRLRVYGRHKIVKEA